MSWKLKIIPVGIVKLAVHHLAIALRLLKSLIESYKVAIGAFCNHWLQLLAHVRIDLHHHEHCLFIQPVPLRASIAHHIVGEPLQVVRQQVVAQQIVEGDEVLGVMVEKVA